jgi:hypothetical protein
MIGVFMKKAPHYKKELKMVLKDKSKFKIA